MRISFLLLLSICSSFFLFGQIQPDQITIARDAWGVPHVFAKTDVEVAYGFGWASCEDDFLTIQKQLLPIRGVAGLVLGKAGAQQDVAVHLIGTRELVAARYEQDLSPEFRAYVEAFVAGVNAYAESHPKEVVHRKLFPATAHDIIEAYVMGNTLNAGVIKEVSAILGGKVPSAYADDDKRGSNAFAISANKTTDGKTYLAINSHQPLEGPNSWYEAHLHSEEGLNILGATFSGGPVIHVGTNEHLGWAHTINYPDLTDVYELRMHPTDPDLYRFDGRWERLEPYHTKARIKVLGFLPLGQKQKFYQSKYGVTFKTDQGVFSVRIPSNREIRAAEQWYRMNKATNLAEFMAALEMRAIINTNIVYADREDHLLYVSNGRFPIRNPAYDWQTTLPGDTSATLWGDEYYPIDSLPLVVDPSSGYVYNCNHTPYLSAGKADNPDPDALPSTLGHLSPDFLTNRAVRLRALLEAQTSFSYEDFKRIKYDLAYHDPLLSHPKLEPVFHLSATQYPAVAAQIEALANWDRIAIKSSEAASVFVLVLRYLDQNLKDENAMRKGDELDETKLVAAVNFAKAYCLEHFGTVMVPLERLQRHQRGEVNLPVEGAPDVLAAMYAAPTEDGELHSRAGDSYIELVRFSADGVEIESVNAYGASAKADSPHFTDQMDLYVNRKLKPMTLDKASVLEQAVRVYHPK
ncbi:MAG: penicillin acylase family protein [Bacteroidota bacterium]